MVQPPGRFLTPFTLVTALDTQVKPGAAQNLGPSTKPLLCMRCAAAAFVGSHKW